MKTIVAFDVNIGDIYCSPNFVSVSISSLDSREHNNSSNKFKFW